MLKKIIISLFIITSLTGISYYLGIKQFVNNPSQVSNTGSEAVKTSTQSLSTGGTLQLMTTGAQEINDTAKKVNTGSEVGNTIVQTPKTESQESSSGTMSWNTGGIVLISDVQQLLDAVIQEWSKIQQQEEERKKQEREEGRYVIKKGKVYYKYSSIDYVPPAETEIDATTFKLLWINNCKDKNYVYFGWEIIKWADMDSFVSFWYYSKDKNYVYIGADILKWADAETFEVINDYYVKDKDHVYQGKNILPTMDAPTLKYNKEKNVVYDKNGVYYLYLKFPWADWESFEKVCYQWYKDKNHAFFVDGDMSEKEKIIPEIDVATMECEISSSTIRDKNNVYYEGAVLQWLNSKKFTCVDYGFCDYVKDDKLVFYKWQKIDGADAESFKYIDWKGAFDKNALYKWSFRYPWADKLTRVQWDYWKDTKNVYLKWKLISGADAKSIKSVWYEYIADDVSVFHKDKKVEGCDSKTFKFLDGNYVKDATHVFYNDVVIKDTDTPSFESRWDGVYAIDKNHVFRNWEIIPNADPKLCTNHYMCRERFP